MRRTIAIIPILFLLSACGPAGVVANSVVKETQGRDASDVERDIKTAFARDPALGDVKISVAINNMWQNAFRTRYSVLLAGTVPDEAARAASISTVRRVIGGSDDAITIADLTRVAPRAVRAD